MERDVLISGAGIAGLALGIRLRQLGFRPLILEKKLNRGPLLRGEFFQPQGVYALDRLGVLDQMRRATSAVQIRTVSHRFKNPVTGWNSSFTFPYPRFGSIDYGLGILHEDILGVMQNKYLELGGEILEAEICELQELKHGFRLKDREDQTYEAAFFVGADGRFSPSRRLSGVRILELPLKRAMATALMKDVVVPEGEFYTEEIPGGVLYAFRYPQNLTRVYVCFPAENLKEASQKKEEFFLHRFSCSKLARSLKPELIGPVLMMPSNDQIALTQTRGRAFWLGDAAGTVDPLGGAGMSVALEDVLRLAEAFASIRDGVDFGQALRTVERRSRRDYLRSRYVGQWIGLLFMAGQPWLRILKWQALSSYRRDSERSDRLMALFGGIEKSPMTIQEMAYLLGFLPGRINETLADLRSLRRLDEIQNVFLTTPVSLLVRRPFFFGMQGLRNSN